jgi:hypothetical protein
MFGSGIMTMQQKDLVPLLELSDAGQQRVFFRAGAQQPRQNVDDPQDVHPPSTRPALVTGSGLPDQKHAPL